MIERVINFLRVHFRDDIERRHDDLNPGFLTLAYSRETESAYLARLKPPETMIFTGKHKRRRLVSFVLAAVTLLAFSACDRATPREQRALRSQVDDALHQKSYVKATELAHRLLKLEPEDDGSWDRLIQAQFGQRDFTAVKQTLEEWRRAVKTPSPKLEEYTGDHAVEVNEPALAVQAWTKLLSVDPKNTGVLEKLARLEKKQQRWAEENSAWTAHIDVRDNATARINRALCRRRLHRWQDAFEDLQRAQELAPNDPEVVRGGKLLEQMGKFLPEIRELAAGLALSPNDPGLLADRALIFLRSEDYELALEDSTEAAKLGPWAVRPKLFQAIALIALGRADECERLAVQKLNPAGNAAAGVS